jgi:type III secretory pathway lipoprotein EscJ
MRLLSVEEQIETLIFYYDGLINGLKTDYEGKSEAVGKTMEVEMNKLKGNFETQISEIKSLVDVEVAEVRKENVGKLSEICGLQEIQCSEMLKMKEEIHKVWKSITMVKYLLFAIFIYFICKKFN